MDQTLQHLFAQIKSEISEQGITERKPLHIIYFMDPICSSCWGIESHIRKLIFEFGDHFSIEYKVGGLLEKLSEGEEKQKMVREIADHWNQMDQDTAMPIDGDIWLEDPIPSSFPPSIAFKSAMIQDPVKAMNLLRSLREMVFLFKKNITKADVLEPAILAAGLDLERIKNDIADRGKMLFEEDLKMAKMFSINWFPTMFFITSKGVEEMVRGPRTYAFYKELLLKLNPNIIKTEKDRTITSLFNQFDSFTTGELSELAEMSRENCLLELKSLLDQKKITARESKNGILWTKIR